MQNDRSGPFVPADKRIREFTLQAVLLGTALAFVMTAANVYLGLYAGMTVSASIPAAVMSMGILRGILKRGTILENNIVQTMASAGEAIAAGIIFTIPALVIAGVWSDFKYWPVTLIAMFGGILGVVFMIPLRKPLIAEKNELVYPEGVACAKVLETGEKRGSGVAYVFSAMIVAGVFKFLVDGYSVIKRTVETAWASGRTAFYAGSDMSVALLGVGFIVGANVSILVFMGGAIAWLIGIPILMALRSTVEPGNALDVMNTVWSSQVRYMGIGAMIVGGIVSIIKVRQGIVKGIRSTILGYSGPGGGVAVLRTEQDMSTKLILIVGLAAIVPTFFLYSYLTASVSIAIVAGIAMIIAGFFFVAVSSYMVGLIGSSNNPVSGMTISTLLLTSGLLLLFGMRGDNGIKAALGVAGVVCCAACMAGDTSQDLKTGYLVGATPWKQQLGLIMGVVFPAFIIAPILTVLHTAHGIGIQVRPDVAPLRAPQATLFASISRAMFTDRSLPWTMVVIGIFIGLALLAIDAYLQKKDSPFRAYVMPVAVGIYLPLSLATPILIGGILNFLVARSLKGRTAEETEERLHTGVLFSSGLIAGESIMGIIIAALIFAKRDLPKTLVSSDALSLGIFAVSVVALYWVAIRKQKAAA